MEDKLVKHCSKCGRTAGEVVNVGNRNLVVKFQKTSYHYKGVKKTCERPDCNVCRLAEQRTYEFNNRAYINAKRNRRRMIKRIKDGKDA